MKDNLKISVYVYDEDNFLKQMWSINVNLTQIVYKDKILTCNINTKDLDKIRKYYHVNIIRNYSKNYLLIYLKKNIIGLISLVFGILLFVFLSNVIVDVNIQSDNTQIVNDLSKELDNYEIKRLTLKKNFYKIQEIKNKIKEKYNNQIEWIEIKNVGMKYVISLELRKSKVVESDDGACNIVAESDGIITNIKAESGVVMVKNNQAVKEGDILISGSIKFNEEVKKDVCSKGLVFAEKWYNVTIDIPTTYQEKVYTGKKRSNLLLEIDNRDKQIFKSRFANYDTEKKEIISLLGHKLYLLNEYEYKYVTKEYDENELDERIDNLVIEKLKLSLRDNEKILYKNVLKKDVNDSRIRVELFVTIEKLISKQVKYEITQ